jgi:hypothetical protein
MLRRVNQRFDMNTPNFGAAASETNGSDNAAVWRGIDTDPQ